MWETIEYLNNCEEDDNEKILSNDDIIDLERSKQIWSDNEHALLNVLR